MPYKGVWEAFILFDSPPPAPFKRGVAAAHVGLRVDGDQLTIPASSQFFDTTATCSPVTCASARNALLEEAQDED